MELQRGGRGRVRSLGAACGGRAADPGRAGRREGGSGAVQRLRSYSSPCRYRRAELHGFLRGAAATAAAAANPSPRDGNRQLKAENSGRGPPGLGEQEGAGERATKPGAGPLPPPPPAQGGVSARRERGMGRRGADKGGGLGDGRGRAQPLAVAGSDVTHMKR